MTSRVADRSQRGDGPGRWAFRAGMRGRVGVPRPATAMTFHRTLPGYRPTALIGLPGLASELGVGAVWVKDESDRLGLPAFKILGASWAVNRALADRFGPTPLADHLDGLRGLVAGTDTTLVTASDGNHGRALARMAALLGIRARVHLPRGLGPAASAAIAAEGAEVVHTGRDYDGSVRQAARSTVGRAGELLVQDTSWPGYDRIPRWVVDGYATLFGELDEQLDGWPDLVAVPTGVGSLLQSALQHYRAPEPGARPAVLAVEPDTAACVTRSLAAGRPVRVDTTKPTIMAGLNCGTVSSIAWPVIDAGLDAAVTVSDGQAGEAVAELDRHGVQVGPCGAAALAGVRAVLDDPGRRAVLGVHRGSVLVLISTEGRNAGAESGLASEGGGHAQ